MDFVLPTHEAFYPLQQLGTLRNGGFVTDTTKKPSLSSRSLRVTAVYIPDKLGLALADAGQTRNGEVSLNRSNFWKLIETRQLEKAFTALKNMVSSGETLGRFAYRRLIGDFCKAGKTRMAAQVVKFLETSQGRRTTIDVGTFTELIKELCKAGEIDNALNLVRRMCNDEWCCNPDVVVYNILINGMFRGGRFEEAIELLHEMRSRGFEPDEFTCSIVVSGMCRLGRLDEAIKLVSSMNPCVVSYNTVLNELCNSRRLTDAENLFKDMPCSPSEATFRILIRSLCRKSSSDRAMELLESMPRYGCIPDACHYNLVIHCLCKEKKMGKAIEYIEVMTSRGCSPTTAIFNTMLAAFWRDGKVDAAVDLFNQLSCYSRNLATYFISIEGFSKLGRTDEALELLDELRSSSSIKGFKPNPECYTTLIIALIREARVDESMEILDELNGSKVGVRSKYYNWIVCALCNVGEIDRGIDVLACMVSKGCKPWNASYGVVIEGLARAGFGREGMELVNELLLKGIVDEDWTKNVAARIERICR